MWVTSRRRASGAVETKVSGRVDLAAMLQMIVDYEAGGGRVWYIDASGARSYSREAMALAVRDFPRLASAGLVEIVAFITQPIVKMGAQTVAMSLAVARSPLRIRIVDRVQDFG